MRKASCVLLFAVMCVLVSGNISSADPKAFDYHGFFDPAGRLDESDRAALNASLKEIYDKYGFSVYMFLLSGEGVKMSQYAADFLQHSIVPHMGEIKHGVVFAWDDQTNDAYAMSFPSSDRVMDAFTSQFLLSAMNSSFAAASSVFEALDNMATVLQKRAAVHFGSNAGEKAFNHHGFSDVAGKLGESDRAALNASLKETYDRYGFSLYVCYLSGEGVKMSQYATKFFNDNVAPYMGEIKYGVIFAWDEQTSDVYAVPFPVSDNRVVSAVSTEFLLGAINSSFASASSAFEALKNMATALQKRAGEFSGANQ